jgi:hypothetical protein
LALALSLTPEEDEDEEDDEDLIAVLDCIKCGESIHLTEEIFIFKLVRPYMDRATGQVVFQDCDRHGELLEEAAVHCFTCWEETNEEAEVACRDVPPVTHPDGLCTCDNCGSDILEGETMGVATYGEIHWSDRQPDGVSTPAFEPLADSKHICIVCLNNLDLEYIRPDFAAHVDVREQSPNLACSLGLPERCWRHGTCIDSCNSHRK